MDTIKTGIGRGCVVIAFALVSCVAEVSAAFECTIRATDGIGDVAMLTNKLTEFNALDYNDCKKARIWLEPGLYDLRGISMKELNGNNHLYVNYAENSLIAGLGESPADTVLLGGGAAEEHRVIFLCGGGNTGWTTVSNLTITGGYTSNNGGGIGSVSTGWYSHLIVSNNYCTGTPGGGGGGIANGYAEHCLFTDNRTEKMGGGFWTNGGYGVRENQQAGAYRCVFSNNVANSSVAGRGGGALYLLGKCRDCTFTGNTAVYGGAVRVNSATYTWHGGAFTGTTEIAGCTFVGNGIHPSVTSGNGTAFYTEAGGTVVSNCTFDANSGDNVHGEGVVYGGDLIDCDIINNCRTNSIIHNCNLLRCTITNNFTGRSGQSIDTFSGDLPAMSFTNANCLFAGNSTRHNGHVSKRKAFVNCTVVGNWSYAAQNYGGILRDGGVWNCILAGNYVNGLQVDMRLTYGPAGSIETSTIIATNCVIQSFWSGDGMDYPGIGCCKQTSNLHLADGYVPTVKSPACNSALQEDWILSCIGDVDMNRAPRVFWGRLDIGAYECQEPIPGSFIFIR